MDPIIALIHANKTKTSVIYDKKKWKPVSCALRFFNKIKNKRKITHKMRQKKKQNIVKFRTLLNYCTDARSLNSFLCVSSLTKWLCFFSILSRKVANSSCKTVSLKQKKTFFTQYRDKNHTHTKANTTIQFHYVINTCTYYRKLGIVRARDGI